MAVLAEFRLNRRNWFRCAYCGHRTWQSHARVRQVQHRPWLLFEHRCPSCKGICVQLRPGLIAAAMIGSLVATFPIVFYLLGSSLGIDASLLVTMVIGLGIGLLHTYAVMPLVTRLIGKYAESTEHAL